MTDAAYKTDTPAERPKRRRLPRPTDTLWVTDAELIRRSGVPERIMRENLKMWDRNPRFGFPPKLKLYGERRYWPHVEAYFARASQVKIPVISGSNRND